jgi:DNA segregation ATPase FtsK/SpoIIIE, S-DNA-T family
MSGSGEGVERLELRLTVDGRAGSVDLALDALAGHTVADLAAAAAAELGEPDSAALWCERRGRGLDPGTALIEAGLRWGDRLALGPIVREATQVGGRPRVELAVGSGPCAGQRWELGDGSFRLGRDPTADVHIDDPSISRDHLEVRVTEGEVSVVDIESANGAALDGARLRPNREYRLAEGEELELGRTMVRVRSLGPTSDSGVPLVAGRLEFNRPPRVRSRWEPFEEELPPPPSRGRRARLPLAASLLPLAAGLLLFFLLDSPVMLAIAGLSPLMAIGSYVGDRRSGKKSFGKDAAAFRRRLEEVTADLDRSLAEETVRRRADLPDAATLIARVRELAPSIWERRRDDEDFLTLRVGVADLSARSGFSVARGGDAELREEVEAALETRRTVTAVPVPLELARVGAVGLAGAHGAARGLARWLVLQAAILHSPDDLVIVAALGESAATEWEWLKWLPHLRPDRLGALVPGVGIGRAAAQRTLGEVGERLSLRNVRDRREMAREPYVLLLLDESLGLDRSLVGTLLDDASDRGVAAIWLGAQERDLPGQVGAIVTARRDRAVLDFTDVGSGELIEEVSADSVAARLAEETARRLAPLRDISERGRAGDIPRRVALLELLGLAPPTAAGLSHRWERWSDGLRVTIGVGADGPLTIDLPAEGPHALIAGTTGSGKSELLRTFVAAAAAAVPPDRLIFLLVDYKGGAAFAPCAGLPHVVDVVSDLDDHLAERALVSLEAELKRRERTLAEHGAKDLRELLRRRPDIAPPLLVIAVDEFAKLREEIPEFVDGVVDIAQRGRSLGVHMVLAAQTLRNAFTPAIRANTNLRVALRVADASESEDVIGSPLADRIPAGEGSRGRAFVRTGSGAAELRELQTAYVSGHSAPLLGGELRVSAFGSAGGGPTGDDLGERPESDVENDLTALAEAARDARSDLGLVEPAPPWLPVLPDLLGLDDLDQRGAAPGRAVVGLVDLPRRQLQVPLVLDLPKAGNVAIFGGGGSGRTTALATTALALAGAATPADLNLFVLDAGGGHLAPLAGLPHCAGVVGVDDEERVERLFRELQRRIERSVASRRAGGAGDAVVPQRAVLLLDDIGAFAQQYDRPGYGLVYESLQRVLGAGRGAGVHVVLTAARRGDLRAALAAHVDQRLVLRMPTEEDMRALGLEARAIRGARLPPGRGFTADSEEFQLAVPLVDGEPASLDRAVASMPAGRGSAAPIDVLPDAVAIHELGPAEGVKTVPLGVGDEALELAAVDLSDTHFMVAGPYRSGRSTALRTLARGLREAMPEAELQLLAPRRSPLVELDCWDEAATGAAACAAAAEALRNRAEAGDFDARPAFVVIDDAGELSEALTATHLERLVQLGRDSRLRMVVAAESAAARGIGVSWIRELRREGHGLLLQPADLASDGELFQVRLPRRVAAPLVPGRGFLVRAGRIELVQVAHDDAG